MKYVMFEVTMGSLKKRIPIIFPNELVHQDIGLSIADILKSKHEWNAKLVSAGEVNFAMDCHCHGSSETLGLKAQSEIDDDVINMNDYGGSFV